MVSHRWVRGWVVANAPTQILFVRSMAPMSPEMDLQRPILFCISSCGGLRAICCERMGLWLSRGWVGVLRASVAKV